MARQKIHVPPLDSPSKQLILDLARDLEKVHIFNTELKKVHAYERKVYYENLDRIDQEREAVHTAALDEAAAFHDRIREEAEATLREHLRAEEEDRLRQEEEAQKERERIERENAEKLRRKQEEAARLEAERKAREEAKKKAEAKAEEEAERTRRAALEEKERKEREESERRVAEKRKEEEDAKKAQEESDKESLTHQQQKLGGVRLTSEEIRVHERYVELHKVLKDMRKWLQGIGKQQPAVKQAMGDMRRAIKKCVGQLRDSKGANKQQVNYLLSLKNAPGFND